MLDGLTCLLEGMPGVETIWTARDGREALDKVRELSPDVVVMDITMPNLCGIEAARQIHAAGGPPVIILSVQTSREFALRAMAAGALGFVCKIDAYQELVQALQQVVQGLSFVSSHVANLESVYDVLSSREREVLQLVAEGRTSAEAAAQMHIAVSTVETHRANILRKLGLHGTAELTKHARNQGLTPP